MTRLGRYRLERIVGEGGMGVVHLGFDEDERRVAVKVLRPQIVGDAEARERLAREVETLQRVTSPWVAEILDADPFGPTPYVVTRYVPGRSLYDVVTKDGPLAGDELMRFAAGLAEGIAAVHAAGVLHRDVKPSNVLLEPGPEGLSPVLIDFGLARTADDPRLTHTGWLLGTPGYLAPEVLFGEEPTELVDVHAWGATVTFAALGRSPFGRGPAMAVMDRTRRGEFDLDGLDPALRPLVEAALAPEPARRPSLAAVQAALAAGLVPRTQVLPTALAPVNPRLATSEPVDASPTVLRPLRITISERSRRLSLWLLGAGAAALWLAAFPWIGLGWWLIIVWVLRSGSMATGRLGERRAVRGAKWHDRPRFVLGIPLHLIRAAPSTAVLVLWSLALVVAAILICYAVAASPLVSLTSSGVVVVLAMLLGPGGTQVRQPLSRVVNPSAADVKGWLITALVLVAIAGLGAGLAARGADWAPWNGPPFSGLVDP